MRYINRAAIGVWIAIGVLLLVWTFATAGANAGQQESYKEEVEKALYETLFWQMVAGERTGPPGQMRKLAEDLRALSVEELPNFRGDSNRYGGITDELQFDPFNGPNCSECGPLDEDVITKATLVKQGDLGEVLQEIAPEEPSDKSGPPSFLWFVWLAALAPVLYVPYKLETRKDERKYREFGAEMALVDSIDKALPETTGNEQYDLRDLRDRLNESVEARLRYGEEEVRARKLGELRREAQETLEAMEAGDRFLTKGEGE